MMGAPKVEEVKAIVGQFLTEKEAAVELHCSTSHLRNMRSQQRGPMYVKLGSKILYRRSDLNRYVNQNTIDPERL